MKRKNKKQDDPLYIKPERIAKSIRKFNAKKGADERLASFDYCYSYFSKFRGKALLKDKEKSCAVLFSFLASWGMLRGSSFLRGRSMRSLIPVIEWIAQCDKRLYTIAPNEYVTNLELLIDAYNRIREKLRMGKSRHITLVTKIMLGVFGCVPAYDRFFCKAFSAVAHGECSFTSFQKKSLTTLSAFYVVNKMAIDKHARSIKTYDFNSGRKNGVNYTPAKIIDMFGYINGQ